MALPSGYTKLDYIESSGTQYINTGFTPKGNSRVVMDFENMLIPADAAALFGARTDTEKNVFGMWFDTTAVQPQYGNVTYNTKPIAVASYNVRQIYDLNKGVAAVGETSVTFNQLTFNSGCALTLLAMNTNGTVDERRASGKIYSAKVYDNGTLVRDFIPCKNASGTLGLWDNVNSVFYANAGTGTFSTGKKHKTLIDDTGYEIKSGRVLIAGTGYDIKKGRTLIGGTGYDISFGTPVGELDIRTSVFANFGNTRREFIVVNQGNPDTAKYDASCNGTWLLIKNCYGERMWDKTDKSICNYSVSSIHGYLNDECLNLFDSDMRSLIKTVKIPYINCSKKYSGDSLQTQGPVNSGANGVTAQLFLLSPYEVGWTKNDSEGQWLNDPDGARLEAFKSSTEGNSDRIAYLEDGSLKEWWLRSPRTGSITDIFRVEVDGTCQGVAQNWGINEKHTVTSGVRFALILPQETLIDSDFNIIPA